MKQIKSKIVISAVFILTLIIVSTVCSDEQTYSKRFIYPQGQEHNRLTLTQWQEINTDVVLLLEFEDENLFRSIPVTYTPNEPEKYFRKSLEGNYDSMGNAFIDEISSPDSQNILINGHSSKTKDQQFTFLKKFADQTYFENHPIFKMFDQNGEHTYFVLSFCEYDLEREDVYLGWFTSSFRTQKTARQILQISLSSALQSRFGIINEYHGQTLITLITCNMNQSDTRYVLTAIEL